jgi:hypothetical protein
MRSGGANRHVGCWSVLVAAALVVAVGCAPPSPGEAPSNAEAPSDTADANDPNADDSASAKDDASAPTAAPEQAPRKRAAQVIPADAGAEAAAPPPVPCSEPGAVLFHGHCYFALTNAASWDDSETACVSAGAHLATLTTADEQSAAAAILPNAERWIGLRRPAGAAVTDASYGWVTSEPRGGFANWATSKSEPNGLCSSSCTGAAECARLLTGDLSGQWSDDACNMIHPALCERQ